MTGFRTVSNDRLVDGEKLDLITITAPKDLDDVVTNADLSNKVDKTTTVNGQPLSSDVTVTKSDVGLGNVDNTSDANKPVSTATNTALNSKQDTLVSGTNIKTINGNSLLGSGNISISGSGGAWGTITGTISEQTDLQSELDGKVDENAAIVGATKTKITYDSKGLVTAGSDATTADIADSLNKRYVTDAQLTVIGNTSGTNTGDQNIFSTIAVYGQSNVVADSTSDTVTFVAGSGITITTDDDTDTITFNSSGGTAYQSEPLQDYQGQAFIGPLGCYVFDRASTIDEVTLISDSIPVGSNLILELRKNSYTSGNILNATTQITTSDTLTNGKKQVSQTSFTSASVSDGDYVVPFATSVGSTTPATNVLVMIKFHS